MDLHITQQTIFDIINYLQNHWHYIIFYSFDGLSIAIVLQWIKRHFKLDEIEQTKLLGFIKTDGKKIVAVLLTVFAAADTFTTWLVDPSNAQFIPQRYAMILATAFYAHRFFVSPAGEWFKNKLQPYLAAVAQVKNEEQASVLTPATATTLPPVAQPTDTTPKPFPSPEG